MSGTTKSSETDDQRFQLHNLLGGRTTPLPVTPHIKVKKSHFLQKLGHYISAPELKYIPVLTFPSGFAPFAINFIQIKNGV